MHSSYVECLSTAGVLRFLSILLVSCALRPNSEDDCFISMLHPDLHTAPLPVSYGM